MGALRKIRDQRLVEDEVERLLVLALGVLDDALVLGFVLLDWSGDLEQELEAILVLQNSIYDRLHSVVELERLLILEALGLHFQVRLGADLDNNNISAVPLHNMGLVVEVGGVSGDDVEGSVVLSVGGEEFDLVLASRGLVEILDLELEQFPSSSLVGAGENEGLVGLDFLIAEEPLALLGDRVRDDDLQDYISLRARGDLRLAVDRR
ncbi:hypothetical protein PMAYCL1PPCAC_32623, partial [Pristionchus mayeri]